MRAALIGYTGLVGSNILRKAKFDELYNSRNLSEIQDKSFDLVVCAGVPAVKWWANQNPQEDLKIIEQLASIYKSINAKRFVLISTVDVYDAPANVNENTIINHQSLSPYGKHRLILERELEGGFEHFHVIRLPGLFGKGLKKNILFDMLCGNLLEKINLESTFQWYPLTRIWDDIQVVIQANLSLVNLAVEPLLSQVIKDQFFSQLIVGTAPLPKVCYEMQTLHSAIFGQQNSKFIMTSDEVMYEMANWLKDPGVNCD